MSDSTNNDVSPILFSIDEFGVGTLLLNRPDKLNSFTVPMIDLWYETLVRASEDPAVRVIVVTGAGRAFCAGGAVEDMLKFPEQNAMERKDYLWKHVHRIALHMERMDKPVIAAMNGLARGAGLDMAMMCDLRTAAASATMAEAYINMGLIAGDGGGWFLPRVVGTARALELLWRGNVITAQEAERIGLVNHVFPDASLLSETLVIAREIARQPQHAIRFFKRSVYQGLSMPLMTHLDMVSSHMSVLEDLDEQRAKVAGFANRKKN